MFGVFPREDEGAREGGGGKADKIQSREGEGEGQTERCLQKGGRSTLAARIQYEQETNSGLSISSPSSPER